MFVTPLFHLMKLIKVYYPYKIIPAHLTLRTQHLTLTSLQPVLHSLRKLNVVTLSGNAIEGSFPKDILR